ncbi:MAG: ice-binding family protein [Candidatus Saccharibacteria bacterium]
MKYLQKTSFGLVALLLAVFAVSPAAYAATSPSLGVAGPFSVLSGSYVNTTPGTVLNGDLGYTTGPAVTPTVNGNTRVADATYNQAGIDQGSTLSALASQTCDFTFAAGAVNLATDATHTSTNGGLGHYDPGVYCIPGALDTTVNGTITLDGAGTYIFRMDGALTTGANSNVVLAGGANACNVWWTPTAATTLGATSTFAGTIIDASGITIGSTVTWTGRALAFGGTVTSDIDTINTVPGCSAASTAAGVGAGTSGAATTPGLPNTGLAAQHSSQTPLVGLGVVISTALLATYLLRKKYSSAA